MTVKVVDILSTAKSKYTERTQYCQYLMANHARISKSAPALAAINKDTISLLQTRRGTVLKTMTWREAEGYA